MVNAAKPESDRSARIVKLLIFAAALIIVGLPLAIWAALEPLLGPVLFPPPWKKELNQAKQLWHANRAAAEAQINKALQESSHAPIAQQMELRRSYAELLDRSDDYQASDEQLESAIALAKNGGSGDTTVADQLTHAYQDLAFDKHARYLKDRTLPAGDKEQEMSVSVAEKNFGANSNATTYKLAGLGSIYGDMLLPDKAKSAFDRALSAMKTDKGAAEAGWYVYAMMARSEVMQHHFDRGIEYYLQSIHSPTPHEKRWRAWSEFTSALEYQKKYFDPDIENVETLFNKERFQELEAIAEKYRKSQEMQPSGYSVLDKFYANLRGSGSHSDESDLTQKLFEFKKWRKQFPDSPTARIALADCYTDYAWHARGSGESDTVTKDGWRLFEKRLEEARKALDGDPAIKSKCPRAFYAYGTCALGQGTGKEYYSELVDDCYKKWPKYRTADLRGCYFLLPRWYGEEHEWLRFAKKVADRVGGGEGDALYAQMVYENRQYYDNVLEEEPTADWNRIKRGCKQVIADFPNDMRARLMFFDFGAIKGDDDAMKEAFAGMQTAEK